MWYLMADSSPQAGQDWENFVAYRIRHRDLLMCFSMLDLFAGANLDGNKPAPEKEVHAMEILSRSIEPMLLPPSALGSKRCGAAHKLHALLHSLRLIFNTFDNVAEALHGLVCITSDLGAERLFTTFACQPLSRFFPWASATAKLTLQESVMRFSEMEFVEGAPSSTDDKPAPVTPGAAPPSPTPLGPDFAEQSQDLVSIRVNEVNL